MLWKLLLVSSQAYLLGSIPFGYLLYRARQGGDVRATGSGNIGATNVLRGAGMAAGAATLVLDAAKGYVAVALAGVLVEESPEGISLAAVFAVLGHIFSLFLKFRGGKGVATGLGVFLAISPAPILVVLLIFVMVAAWRRYVSLASVLATGAFPFVLLAFGEVSPYVIAAAFLAAALIIARHGSNIQRLLLGTEERITGKAENRG